MGLGWPCFAAAMSYHEDTATKTKYFPAQDSSIHHRTGAMEGGAKGNEVEPWAGAVVVVHFLSPNLMG